MKKNALFIGCNLFFASIMYSQPYIEFERGASVITAKRGYGTAQSSPDTIYNIELKFRLYVQNSPPATETFVIDISGASFNPIIQVNTQNSFSIDVIAAEWPASGSKIITRTITFRTARIADNDTSREVYILSPRAHAKFRQDIHYIHIITVEKESKPDTKSDHERDSMIYEQLKDAFHYTIFTDFKGFRGDQPNGIIQSEIFFNFRFRGDQKEEEKEWGEFCHNIHIGANLTKLGNNLRYRNLNIDTLSGQKHLHYIDLVRYTNFEGYIKLNFVYIRFDKINKTKVKIPLRLYVDLFGCIKSTGVRDTSLATEMEEFNANSVGYGANFKLATAFISNKRGHLDFEIGFTPYTVKMQNNNFKLSGGPLYYPENNPMNNSFRDDRYSKTINRFDFKIQYAPDLDKQQTNIFFRLMYHTNPLGQAYRSQGFVSNSFMQVQLGYVGSFSSLFPSKL